MDGENIFSVGETLDENGDKAIDVVAKDVSGIPKEYRGFKVVAIEGDRPVAL